MSEAERRMHQAAMERMLDLLEDLSLSEEDLQRMIPDFGGIVRVDDMIEAYRGRICRWQPPARASTPQEESAALESYERLARVVSAFSASLRRLWSHDVIH